MKFTLLFILTLISYTTASAVCSPGKDSFGTDGYICDPGAALGRGDIHTFWVKDLSSCHSTCGQDYKTVKQILGEAAIHTPGQSDTKFAGQAVDSTHTGSINKAPAAHSDTEQPLPGNNAEQPQ